MFLLAVDWNSLLSNVAEWLTAIVGGLTFLLSLIQLILKSF